MTGRSPDFDRDALLAKAQIPLRHRKIPPRTDDDRSVNWWAKMEKVCGKMGSGALLALLGNRGTGKTQAAVAAMQYTAHRGHPCFYCKAMEVFLEVRATYARPDRAELEVIKKYQEPRLLVIDEVQQRGETDFENRILAHLIDKRYDAMVDTIIIGNLTPEAMAERLDPSIVDRLRETGGVVVFEWESFRTAPPDDGAAAAAAAADEPPAS